MEMLGRPWLGTQSSHIEVRDGDIYLVFISISWVLLPMGLTKITKRLSVSRKEKKIQGHFPGELQIQQVFLDRIWRKKCQKEIHKIKQVWCFRNQVYKVRKCCKEKWRITSNVDRSINCGQKSHWIFQNGDCCSTWL